MSLDSDQVGVRPTGGLQLVVGASLDDPTEFEDDDLISIANGAEPMSDDDAGAPPAAEVVVDDLLGLGVERTRGLVENQHTGMAGERPGYFETLT